MVAGGLFNAFAFAGAGYLFKMINSDGYGKELKRHNLAMEELTKAQQAWTRKKYRRKKKHANYDKNVPMRTWILTRLISHSKSTKK